MIKIRLELASNGIIYQVLEMPEQLRVNKTLFYDIDSNCKIISYHDPEICVKDSTQIEFFLRGKCDSLDNKVHLLTSDKHLVSIYNRILKALDSFVKSKEYKSLMGIPSDPDYHSLSRFGVIPFDEHLVIRLEKAYNALIYQVIKIPECIRGNFIYPCSATNMVVKSVGVPEHLYGSKSIYLQGNESKCDDRISIINFDNDTDRNIYYDKLITTFVNLVESREYKDVVHAKDVKIPTSGIYTFG
ncbi:MAG: hypothetical protein EO766_12185 [Hydrotalea sp. AMD]|uniref:hypothetical protein n=1 Tax=Hydrotalea sp. AMD TaxID=2501297 RepID=UPI001028334B|nr:hypothetical protein [Hydrotalea sp. AMD]RWZ87276.1 MAG: hypothetical protein EO766_12185 [Hydrotalea sp. AMD]